MTESHPTPSPEARPAPRWGEYADVAPPPLPTPPVAGEPQYPELPPARTRRTGDMVITVALLVVGLYDVITGFSTFANLAPVFAEVYAQQGIGEFTAVDAAATAGLVVNVSRITILLATIAVSLSFISRGRRAFWVPLTGAALAAVVTLICFAIVMANDPAFTAYVDTLR